MSLIVILRKYSFDSIDNKTKTKVFVPFFSNHFVS
jgi:hypothetical protein